MDKKIIINIGRQFGTGGHEVGKRLSKQFNIPLYDKDLITLAAKESGYSEALFNKLDEKPTNSFLYSIAMGSFIMGNSYTGSFQMPLNDKLFLIQSDIILKKAEEGSCIFVGRCADYVLRDKEECINVFIHAPLEERIKIIAKERQLSEEKAKELVIKTDKARANYYNYFTNAHWGKAENYHLTIDSGKIGINNCVELIRTYVKMKYNDL